MTSNLPNLKFSSRLQSLILGSLLLTSSSLVLAGLSGCIHPDSIRTGDPATDLHSLDKTVVMWACERAVHKNDQKAVEHLIYNLRSQDDGIRMWSHAALKKLTGQNFSYQYFNSIDDREVAVEKWEHWYAKNIAPIKGFRSD